jgi:hypothetical protein
MAITSGQLTVSTTRQILDGTSNSPYKLVIHNSGSNAIYIGNEEVTETNGLNIHANSTLMLDLPALTTIYAITSSGNHELSWLRIS